VSGISDQPAFVLQYGPSGTGKTTDDLLSFPRAVWIAAPGALKSSLGVCGYEPPADRVFDVQKIAEATAVVEQIGEAKRAGKAKADVDGVVVDDLTLLVDRTVAALTKSGTGGYDLWAAVHGQLLALREAARRAGVHVALNCHEIGPRIVDGARFRGCPALPGKTLPYKIPAACDMVLHVETAPPNSTAFGWPVRYRCAADDPDWLTKDRHNVTPDPSPMNLGEILRLAARVSGNAKFAPRRLPGLEWQEPLVEKGATALLTNLGSSVHVKAVLGELFKHATGKLNADERHALWAVRDAYDRAILRNGLAAHRRKFFGL
jgi:hypothetical protein